MSYAPDQRFAEEMKALRDELATVPEGTPFRQASEFMATLYEQAYHSLALHYVSKRINNPRTHNTEKDYALWHERTASLREAYTAQGFAAEDIEHHVETIHAGKLEINRYIGEGTYTFSVNKIERIMNDNLHSYTMAVEKAQHGTFNALPAPGR